MKNNKGYYSWIHSLKQAAIQSHTKGAEMLFEAKKRVEQGPDLDVKAAIDAEIRARGERKALSARELAAAGDANDVAVEAQGDEDEDHIPDIVDRNSRRLPDSRKLPTYNVPATPVTTEHPEPWYKTPEESNRAAREMGAFYRGETAPEEEDFVPPHEEKPAAAGGAWSKPATFRESVNNKIKKIISEMRGDDDDFENPAIGGMMRPGTSTERASLGLSDPELEEVYRGLKGPRNETTKMRHLIQIISNPEKYPPHHYRIAHERLTNLGIELNKGKIDS